jgi:hypothetical protein
MRVLLLILVVGCLMIQGCSALRMSTGKASVHVQPSKLEESILDFSVKWPIDSKITNPGGSSK